MCWIGDRWDRCLPWGGMGGGGVLVNLIEMVLIDILGEERVGSRRLVCG